VTRTCDNLQEVGWLADNGRVLRTDTIAEVSLVVTRRSEKDDQGRERPGNYIAHLYFKSARTGEILGDYERPFASLDEVCDLFGIDEIDDMWEVLDA